MWTYRINQSFWVVLYCKIGKCLFGLIIKQNISFIEVYLILCEVYQHLLKLYSLLKCSLLAVKIVLYKGKEILWIIITIRNGSNHSIFRLFIKPNWKFLDEENKKYHIVPLGYSLNIQKPSDKNYGLVKIILINQPDNEYGINLLDIDILDIFHIYKFVLLWVFKGY